MITDVNARQIMFKKLLGIDCGKYFDLRKAEEVPMSTMIPFNSKDLRDRKKTHILVAVQPISLSEMVKLPKIKPFFTKEILEFAGEAFFNQKNDDIKWCLIPIVSQIPVDSFEAFGKENPISNVVIHSVQEIMYAMIVYHFRRHEKIFKNKYISTRSFTNDGHPILIGWFEHIELRRQAFKA